MSDFAPTFIESYFFKRFVYYPEVVEELFWGLRLDILVCENFLTWFPTPAAEVTEDEVSVIVVGYYRLCATLRVICRLRTGLFLLIVDDVFNIFSDLPE